MSTERVHRRIVWSAAAVVVAAGTAGTWTVQALSSDRGHQREAATRAAAPEPLAPLTEDEILTTFRVIEASPRFPDGAFFPIVTLKEPPKSELLAEKSGRSFRREAFANVYDRARNRLYEAVVDLERERLVSWVELPGVQPAVFETEYVDADLVVRADPEWREAMRRRGIAPRDVYLDVWAPGELEESDAKAKPGARLLRAISFYRGPLPNPYGRPIEGVVVTVDMNDMDVVDVIDTGVRPVNTTLSGDADAPRTGLKPLTVRQGGSFEIHGHEVTWQNWHFRVGFTPREGLVLHQIGYEKNGEVRPIIHRIALDEVWVPYGIPDLTWVWRAALDIGEYNLGQYASPLRKNIDVPENAEFFDEVSATDIGSAGGAFEVPNAIAVYERDGGSLWDRTDPTSFDRDARLARELVVTFAYPNGNYTYQTDYVFGMDGGIDVLVRATGTLLTRGVSSVEEGNEFGTPVAEHIAAPSHQHFFNFRIDFDVDGMANRVVEVDTESVPSEFGNAFEARRSVLETEQARDHEDHAHRTWLVESATRTNALGEPTAYRIEPIDHAIPYAEPTFGSLRRAPFAQHPFWVTAYRDGELHAPGDYPNQGEAGEGLTEYVSPPEDVRGTDLVVWYTAGMTHHPVPEEYPVMPTEAVGFSLRPSGFFDRNPALDAPKQR